MIWWQEISFLLAAESSTAQQLQLMALLSHGALETMEDLDWLMKRQGELISYVIIGSFQFIACCYSCTLCCCFSSFDLIFVNWTHLKNSPTSQKLRTLSYVYITYSDQSSTVFQFTIDFFHAMSVNSIFAISPSVCYSFIVWTQHPLHS